MRLRLVFRDTGSNLYPRYLDRKVCFVIQALGYTRAIKFSILFQAAGTTVKVCVYRCKCYKTIFLTHWHLVLVPSKYFGLV
jgi:hypothetical protein